jgi:hypothetical protein
MVYVSDQMACQQHAISNGHPYYSFRHNGESAGHKCMSSATCDDHLDDRTNEWYIYSNRHLVEFDADCNPNLTPTAGAISGEGQMGWGTAANAALQVNEASNICGISFKCNTAASHLMLGLSNNVVTRWQDINYGVTCRGSWRASLDIFEDGSRVHQMNDRSHNGNPASDVYAVRISGGQVNYELNGAVFYTSTRPVTFPWHVGLDTYTSPSLSDVEYLQC